MGNQCFPHLESSMKVAQAQKKLPYRNIYMLPSQMLDISYRAINAPVLYSEMTMNLLFWVICYGWVVLFFAWGIEWLEAECFLSGSNQWMVCTSTPWLRVRRPFLYMHLWIYFVGESFMLVTWLFPLNSWKPL